MVAMLKREAANLLHRMGWQRRPDYRPHPQGEIDYEAVHKDVMRRFPNIMKRLAE
jgi:hypothetical protein